MREGIWVEAEHELTPLNNEEKIGELIALCRTRGLSDVYVQAYRGGRCWYSSKWAAKARWAEAQFAADTDPLAMILRAADSAGIHVYAWINALNLGTEPEPWVIRKLGEGVWQVDSVNQRVDSYLSQSCTAKIDTPGIWLDPASVDVRDYVSNIAAEIAAGYPSLAGIHVDFLRYPYALPIKPASWCAEGHDFGYSPIARRRFSEHCNRPIWPQDGSSGWAISDYQLALRWDQWRRTQVDNLLSDIRRKISRAQKLSVAVLPWPDRAYLSAFQDWRSWMLKGLVDEVVLMSYTADDQHLGYLVRQSRAFCSGSVSLLVGIGLHRLGESNAVASQAALAEAQGADGVVYFSWGNSGPLFFAGANGTE